MNAQRINESYIYCALVIKAQVQPITIVVVNQISECDKIVFEIVTFA